MKIFTTNAYSDGNYGKWMNEVMKASPCEWVMFHDHDIYLANRNWYKIVSDAIEANPDGGLFTCVTNRIGNAYQKVKIPDKRNNDIKYHMQMAEQIELREPKIIDLTNCPKKISGLMMVTSKTAWAKTLSGFREKGGYVGVDNCYHGAIKNAGYKIYLMNNLYVYHWYRGSTK